MSKDQNFTHADFETVEYYYAQCIECKTVTKDYDHWTDASMDIQGRDWELIDGAFYCSSCAESEHERQEDERWEEEQEAERVAREL